MCIRDRDDCKQAYMSLIKKAIFAPKELVAFEKTRELQPGESQLMILTWEINDMASYDDLGKVKKLSLIHI